MSAEQVFAQSAEGVSAAGEEEEEIVPWLLDGAVRAVLGTNVLTVEKEISAVNDMQEHPLLVAINNYAVCCLHLKQIRLAVSQLEGVIQLNPTQFLVDPVVFNLCTMYDLLYAPETSATKKKVLQQVAQYYGVDEPLVSWKSFRLH